MTGFFPSFETMWYFGIFIFICAAAVIVMIVVKTLKDNSGPESVSRATVVSKRMLVSGGEYGGTYYYVTFELANGERTELSVNGTQYGLLAEGDTGTLKSRGKAFVSFQREPAAAAAEPEERVHKCPACGATFEGRVCPYCDTPYYK